MRKVCHQFAGGERRTAAFVELLDINAAPPHGHIPPRLVDVANAFVDLQEARHAADYDMAYIPNRQEARSLIERTQQMFDDVAQLNNNPIYNLFLMMLLTGTSVARPR